MNYDRIWTISEIRKINDYTNDIFNNPILINCIKLNCSGNSGPIISEDEKISLLNSSWLKNLIVLDISKCNINDNDIEILSKNETFSRLTAINLDNNPITDMCLNFLLDNYIGTLRINCYPSGKYGCPCSRINISINHTFINIDTYKDHEVVDLCPKNIKYKYLDGTKSVFRDVDDGIIII